MPAFKRLFFVILLLLPALLLTGSAVESAPDLTIKPLTWNIIGLDSNRPASGPRHFPVASRVCSPTGTGSNSVTVDLIWDDAVATYIYIRPGSQSQIAFAPLGAGECVDAYFEVEVNPIAASYNQRRAYHITATAGADSVSTPQPRELYVEYLISQNRNATTGMRYGTTPANLAPVPPGGYLNLLVGETYLIELTGGTATQGYEQFEQFLTLTNTIFRINSVITDYAVNSSPYVTDPSDLLYADACLWENDPASPNYRTCLDSGYKTGGAPVEVTYNVTILSGGGTTETLNSLLYDFSGSSFHYNSDFSSSARFANIIDPSSADISKRFAPSTISPDGTSTLVITLTNPNAGALSGYRFNDTLPAGVVVATPPSASTSGCGTPDFTPGPGDAVLSFSNGTVAGNSSCTISVNVTAASAGAYLNTTDNLYVGNVDTGNAASATLNVVPGPPPPVCTPGMVLARWTMDPGQGVGVPPVASYVSSQVSNAAASFVPSALPGVQLIQTGNGNPINSWSGTGWPIATTPVEAGPGPNVASYFQFDLDTSGFTGGPLLITANINPAPTGNWATPSNITANVHASTNGGPYATIGTLNPVTRDAWSTLSGTVPLPGSTNTTFRINISGRSNGNPDATFLIDNIVFTGCGFPDDPTLAKSFAPDPIAAGGISTLTFTLSNPNPTVALTGVAFDDTLPTGMTVATPPNAVTSCGGTWSPGAGANSLPFSGGAIPANSSCTVRVDVTTAVPGPNTNISGFISSTQTGTNDGPSGSARDTLTVLLPPRISKRFLANPILPGSVSTLSFTIENPNLDDPISGVAFADTFPIVPGAMVVANPSNAINSCGGTWTANAGASSVNLVNGTIAAGDTCTLSVDVTAPVQGSYSNASGLVSHLVNGQPANGNSASDTLIVNPPSPAIAILKQVGTGSTVNDPWFLYLAVAEGTPVYYLITVENAGDVPLSPVSVTDPTVNVSGCTWPDPLPVASALNNNHIATCIVGPVSAVAGVNTNTAQASGSYGGTAYTDSDSATYATTGLSLVKAASPTTYTADGDIIAYTFTITNTGSAVLSGPVTVADSLIASVTCPDLDTIGNLNNFFEPTEQIVCAASYTITLSDVTNGSVTNTATASAGGATSPEDSETVSLPGADLSITKTDGSATYTPGGSVTYTLVVANAGPSDANGAVVVDDLPEPPLSGISWTCGAETGGAVCPNASGTGDLSETIATFPAGGSLTYTITATIAAGATGDLVNTATVTPPAGTTDPDGTNNSATDTDTLSAQADLSITKTDGSATYTPGGSVTYTLVVANAGPSDAGGAVVADDLPEPPLSGISWTCGTETGGAVCPNASGTGDLNETIATFPAGGSLTYTISATIAAGATGDLVNTATVTPPAGTTDPVGTNNSATDTDTISAQADLSITKTDGSATYTPGGSITYTLVVANAGPSDAGGAVVADDLPEPPLSGISWTCGAETGGAVCPNASGTGDLNETIATFPAGGSVTYTITATIAAGATGDLVNTATVTPPAGTTDPDGTNNSATDTDTLNAQADLSITKTDGSATYTPGGSLTYTLVVANAGPSDAGGAVVADDLPEPPLSGISWTCGAETGGAVCPNASGTGDLNETIATFPAGSSVTYTITATIAAGATGDLVNTAAVTPPAGTTDPDGTNNSATDTDTLSAQADLSITKTDGSATYTPGGSITYTLVVANAGPSDAGGAVVADDLPEPPLSNITWTCGTETGGAVCPNTSGTGDLNETIATFPAGGSVTYSITATIAAGATGDLVNTATVTPPAGTTDPDGTNNSATDTDTLAAQADLSITKTDGSATYTPGGSLTYTLVVANAGPSDANGAVVADDLPEPPLSNISWTCGAETSGAVCPNASGTGDLNETIATFPAGGSLTYTVTATIAAGATGDLVNTASVTPPAGTTDPDGTNNSATDTDTLNAQADLSITKTDGSATYTPGGSLTYTLVVANAGPSDAGGAVVADDLPEPPLSGISWTCGTETGGAVCPNTSGTGDLNETIATFPAGSSVTYTITANVAAGASGDLVNTASVTPPAGTTDPDGTNNSATDTDTLNAQADLSITKTDGSATYTPGGSITYTLVVANAGPSDAGNAVVADDLPEPPLSGISWTCGAETGGAVCPNASGTGDVNETIATFPAGGSLTYTVTATIAAGATGDLVNTATVTPPAGTPDPDGTNNSATDTDTLSAQADLSITKTDGSATYTPGGSLTYTLVVANAGPSDAGGAVVADDLPEPPLSGISWTCGTETGGAVCPNTSGTGDLNETIATFPAGSSVTYTITATIAAGATGDLVNTASVTPPAGTTDPNGANNSATDTDTLSAQADLSITKTDGSATYTPGGSVTYTLVVANAGTSDAGGAVVADDLPEPPLSNITWTCGTETGGAVCPNTSGTGDLNETISTFPAGGSLTYTVTATIAAGATGDLVNTASVTPPAGTTDPDGTNNSATDTDTLSAQADLSITKTDGSATYTPGGSVTYTLVVANAGPSDAGGAVVADDLPEPPLSGITWTCGTETGGAVCPNASGTGDVNETIATFPAGGSLTYTVTATIAAGATGDLVNTASVTPPAGTPDPDGTNNSATDTDTISAQADLSITKTDGSATYTPGGSLTYTLVVANAGPSDAGNAVVADGLPEPPLSGISWTCGSETGGAVCPNASGTGDLNETIATFPAGGSLTYTISATIAAGATGDLVNTATVTPPAGTPDPDGTNNSATDTDTLSAQADLSITKTDGSATYTPGGSLTYTLVVANAGPSDAGGVVVADDLPEPPLSNITWMCGTETGGAVCPNASGTDDLNETIATFPAGGSVTYTITATIAAGATGDLVNTATVTPPAGTTDPDGTNNSAMDTDTLNAQADLSITKTDGSATYTPGGSLTYTLVVANAGPSDAGGAVVADDLPEPPLSNITWTCGTETGGAVCPNASGTGDLNETIVTFPAGGSLTYTITATIAAGATGDLVNTASVTPPAGTTDPDGSNNNATDTDTLSAQADLSITKTDGSATYTPGGSVTYTLVVANAGPSDAGGAVVADDLPEPPLSGISWTCGTETGGAVCPNASGTGDVNETLATFPAGGSLTYTVTATIAAGATGDLVNTAMVTPPAGTTDPDGTNDSATDTDTLSAQADLSITKTDGSATYTPGGSVTYTLVVANAGPSDANGAVVTDDLPEPPLSGISWTCGTETGGAVCPNASGTGDLNETIATFPAGGSLTYTVTATIAAGATGDLVNTASVTPPAGTTDPDGTNNSATDTDTLSAQADLSITKTNGSATYTPGGSVTYTLVVANAGPSDAGGAVVADDLPEPPLSGISWTCGTETGGAVCPNTSGTGDLNETIATFPAGSSVTYTITANVAAGATGDLVNTATVTPPAGTTDPDGTNNSATDTDTLSAQADLSITKTDGSATYTPGGSVTYTLVVANAGPSDAGGAVVADDLPEPPLSGISWTCGTETGGAVCPNASGTGDLSETIATFPAGSSVTYTISANVAAGASGDLVNTATVTPPAGTTDPDGTNNSATDTDTLSAQADLSITKTDGSATYTPGGSVTYTLVVANAGPSDTNGAVVADDLPEPPLSNISWTCGTETGGAVCPNTSGAGDLSETIATFPAGSSVTYTISANVAAGATGDLVNMATVTPPAGTTDLDGSNNSATDTDTLSAQADLSITKTDGSATYTPGGSITYTLVVANAGPSDAGGAVVADDLPEPPLSGISWTCVSAASAVCPNASGTGDLSETIATFPAGGSLTYTVTATIAAGATGDLVNTASVTPPAGTTDPDGTNNSATDTDTLSAQADLSITKTDGSATYTPGGSVTYTLVVANAGPSDAGGAVVADDLPEPPLSGVSWTCGTETGGAVCPNASGTGDISETIATFPVGGSLTYTVTADVDASAASDIENTATVSPPPAIPDPDDSNNSATDVDSLVGLEAYKSAELTGDNDGNGLVSAGDVITYTVVIENNGTTDLADLVFTDTPDSNSTLIVGSVTVSDPGALITQDASVTVEIPLLLPGESVTITYDVLINDPLPEDVQSLANQGTVSGDAFEDEPTDDPSTDENDDPTVVVIDQLPTPPPPPPAPEITYFDPAISKVGILEDGGLGLPGERLTWLVTITNVGTGPGYNIVITDDIRAELRIDGADIDRGAAAINGQTVTFTIPSLAPGESVQARIYTTVLQSPFDGQFDNTAYGEGTGPDGVVHRVSGAAVVPVPSELPSTGYTPEQADNAGSHSAWLIALALAMTLAIALVVVRTVAQKMRS